MRPVVITSLAFLVLWLTTKPVEAVPVAPNESLVQGEIVEVGAVDSLTLDIRPQRTLFRVKLRLTKVEAVDTKSNFLQGAEGKTIEVYATDMAVAPPVGKAVKGRISFRGDELSGRYWIVGPLETGPEFTGPM